MNNENNFRDKWNEYLRDLDRLKLSTTNQRDWQEIQDAKSKLQSMVDRLAKNFAKEYDNDGSKV